MPVWGFGRVVASACVEIKVGEQLFGYLPSAQTARLRPRMTAAWRGHLPRLETLLEVQVADSLDRAVDTYRKLLSVGADPRVGYVVSP